MSLDVEIKFNHTRLVSRKVRQAAQLAVVKATEDIQGQAQNKAPVDTGNLKNSIQTNLENIDAPVIEGEVRVGADYGAYVEFGHELPNGKFVPAQPYFIPAVDNVEPEFLEVMARIINSSLGELPE